MGSNFVIGQRIKISSNYHWAKNATGEITKPPEFITEVVTDWKGLVRKLESSEGILSFYWIKFDEPQNDIDGDGHYQEAEIDSRYLEAL